MQNICGQNTNLLWRLGEKGGIGGEGSSSHKTMCYGKRTIATLCDRGENGSSVFAMNGRNTETMMCGDEEQQLFAIMAVISVSLVE